MRFRRKTFEEFFFFLIYLNLSERILVGEDVSYNAKREVRSYLMRFQFLSLQVKPFSTGTADLIRSVFTGLKGYFPSGNGQFLNGISKRSCSHIRFGWSTDWKIPHVAHYLQLWQLCKSMSVFVSFLFFQSNKNNLKWK